jgi:hypothetical protein
MSTVVVPGASAELPLAGTGLDAAGIVAVPDFAKVLRASIDSLVDAVEQKRALGEAVFCL